MAAEQKQEQVADHISLPAPTAWPFVTAFGLVLLAAGVVTRAAMSVVGLILAVRGAVGWFRDVLPVEHHGSGRRALPLEQSAPARSRRLLAPCNNFNLGSQATVFGFRRRFIPTRRVSRRYCRWDRDGDRGLPVWCHCAPQHLVSD